MSDPPHDERECADGVFGWLESPRPYDAGLDCVLISGWTFSRTSRVTDVSARIGNHRWSVEYGMRRDDVKAAYPADAGAAQSGFLTFVEIDRAAPRPERLEVWCRLENGREVRLFTRRLGLHPAREYRAPLVGPGKIPARELSATAAGRCRRVGRQLECAREA